MGAQGLSSQTGLHGAAHRCASRHLGSSTVRMLTCCFFWKKQLLTFSKFSRRTNPPKLRASVVYSLSFILEVQRSFGGYKRTLLIDGVMHPLKLYNKLFYLVLLDIKTVIVYR